jgi:hypothetical protein
MVRQQAALASGQLTRVTSGVNLPPPEVIMSSCLTFASCEKGEQVSFAPWEAARERDIGVGDSMAGIKGT